MEFRLGNEVVVSRFILGNVQRWHMIGNVYEILQGGPYDKFQKITHIPIRQNFLSLKFWFLCINDIVIIMIFILAIYCGTNITFQISKTNINKHMFVQCFHEESTYSIVYFEV